MAEHLRVLQTLCENMGSVEYELLLQMPEIQTLQQVVNNRSLFVLTEQNQLLKVILCSEISLCRVKECQRKCENLHLCKYHLLGECTRRRCDFDHSLETEHNSGILQKFHLQGLNKNQLQVLLLHSDSSLLPPLCVSYNKGGGTFGNCPEKQTCTRLHICENFIRGTCDGSDCARSHDFYEPHPDQILRSRGIGPQLIGSLMSIYGNILALKEHKASQKAKGARNMEFKRSGGRATTSVCSPTKENVICLSFVKGFCKLEERCRRVHFDMPYKWELEVDGVWIDLPENENTECYYCDATRIHGVGEEPVCYDTMTLGVHKVRRLSTQSSMTESLENFVLTTNWLWYWEDEHSTWIQYESEKKISRRSSITREQLEQRYLHFLKDNINSVISFTVGKHSYELDFKAMTQRNLVSNTARSVRRRPEFRSSLSARMLKTSGRRSHSNTHTGVPGYWDRNAVPDSGFQRVPLSDSHKDYIRVQDLFNKTMMNFTVLSIERVQNKELWEDFQIKRERMRKANQHKKFAEGERTLFHGTKSVHIDAICRENFDMRVSGANATVYGQGSYFARDAKYSHEYTDGYTVGTMFACRVLVGQYTKGASSYRRPPARDSTGVLYDSCVNDVRDPTIFVVFERSQVYPEFLITYQKKTFNQLPHAQGTAQLTTFPSHSNWNASTITTVTTDQTKSDHSDLSLTESAQGVPQLWETPKSNKVTDSSPSESSWEIVQISPTTEPRKSAQVISELSSTTYPRKSAQLIFEVSSTTTPKTSAQVISELSSTTDPRTSAQGISKLSSTTEPRKSAQLTSEQSLTTEPRKSAQVTSEISSTTNPRLSAQRISDLGTTAESSLISVNFPASAAESVIVSKPEKSDLSRSQFQNVSRLKNPQTPSAFYFQDSLTCPQSSYSMKDSAVTFRSNPSLSTSYKPSPSSQPSFGSSSSLVSGNHSSARSSTPHSPKSPISQTHGKHSGAKKGQESDCVLL